MCDIEYSEEEMEAGYTGTFLSLEDKFDLMVYYAFSQKAGDGGDDEALARLRQDRYTELVLLIQSPDNKKVFVGWTTPDRNDGQITTLGFEVEDGDELVRAIGRWQKSGRPFDVAHTTQTPDWLWLPPVRDQEWFKKVKAAINELATRWESRCLEQDARTIMENGPIHPGVAG